MIPPVLTDTDERIFYITSDKEHLRFRLSEIESSTSKDFLTPAAAMAHVRMLLAGKPGKVFMLDYFGRMLGEKAV